MPLLQDHPMRLLRLILVLLLLSAGSASAAAPSPGGDCSTQVANVYACHSNGCYKCVSNVWTVQPLIVGATSLTCDSTYAGMLRWTGTKFEGCNGTAWGTVTGGGCDIPNAFSFTNQTGVALSSTITSNTVTLSGFTCPATATCSGCINIIRNGVAEGTSAVFNSGDTIALQVTSSGSVSTAVTATVTVGQTTSGTWSVTTGSNTPNAFSFTDQTNVNTSTIITSNTVTLGGSFSGATATCNTGCISMSRNGAAFVTGPVSGFANGDTIAIRQTSSATGGTGTTASITIGGTTSSTWTVTTPSDPCSAGSPTPGAACTDGTVYAGISPDGNNKMYVTPCDQGQTGTQGACTGTRGNQKWSANGTVTTGITSQSTGRSNTTTLNGLANADSPYSAAAYCENLNQLGYTDWYLPAMGELSVMYTNKTAIGGFETSGIWYWSSSEYNVGNAQIKRFNDGVEAWNPKSNTASLIRCARR